MRGPSLLGAKDIPEQGCEHGQQGIDEDLLDHVEPESVKLLLLCRALLQDGTERFWDRLALGEGCAERPPSRREHFTGGRFRRP